ncbi:MAG: MFS transporter [Candidatus Sumerlaeota bacterium]
MSESVDFTASASAPAQPRRVLWSVSGHRITNAAVQRGIRRNMLSGALGMAFVAVTMGMPMTMLLEAMEAGGVMIGLFGALQNGALIMQIPGAIIVERLASRKRFWVATNLVHRMLWFVPALAAWVVARAGASPEGVVTIIMLSITLSLLMANTSGAAWLSWLSDLVPEKRRGAFWGNRQSVTTLSFLVAVLLAGYGLDFFAHRGIPFRGFALVFGLAALLGCLDILLHATVPEPRPHVEAVRKGLWRSLVEPLKQRNFLCLTISMGLWFFGSNMLAPFSQVYLKRVFGVTYVHLSAILVAASISTIFFGVISGYLMDRIGPRIFAAVMATLGPMTALAWFFVSPGEVTLPFVDITLPQPVLLVGVFSFLSGGIYTGVLLANINLAGIIAPPEGRTRFMAMHLAIVGVITMLGPLTGGYITEWVEANPFEWQLPLGVPFSYLHIIILIHIGLSWFVVVPLLLAMVPKEGEMPLGRALSRMLLVNPLRSLGSIQYIRALGSAGGVDESARAVRHLGQRRMVIAVGDLIDRLDDPSSDVREEAAYALSAIGSPDAIEALIRKLDDPDSDLAPHIARALRRRRSPQALEALLRKVESQDPETRRESVRALGAIGDRRASKALMSILQSSEDMTLVNASSEALARLGEIAAIYDILPRMKSTRNPVLRRSLAVAVGDLLGRTGGFYRILIREQNDHGVEVARLMKDLRGIIRDRTRKAGQRAKRQEMVELSRTVEHAYEEDDMDAGSAALFTLCVEFAALLYGVKYQGDPHTTAGELMQIDQRFSQGFWYLNFLNSHWERSDLEDRDWLDLLLGIYFLASLRPRRSESKW